MSTEQRTTGLNTMKTDGSRIKLHPLIVKGKWILRRRVVFAFLIVLYVGLPFLSIGGHPALFLDIEHRAFWLLGRSFNSQDVWMLLLLALGALFALLFVTAWKGRLWCGWACPQTVFLEGLFRPIETFFEGPRERRLKLAQAPWSFNKITRVMLKHITFILVATAIAHAMAAIVVSPKALFGILNDGPAAHFEAFTLITAFSALLLFNFAWFREQFCVVVCPYGRLQSVLQDQDTVTVAYDMNRGEPRVKLTKLISEKPIGDCVDCNKCVVTCPTGIDIRKGMQMECIACLQCVDACDDVMIKIKKPVGLIRMTSESQLAQNKTKALRPRLVVYGVLTVVSLSAFGVGLLTRLSFEANVLRPRSGNPFVIDGPLVRNAFEIHLINKHSQQAQFSIEATTLVPAEIIVGTPLVMLDALHDQRVSISVAIERVHLHQPVEIVIATTDISSGEKKISRLTFLAPPNQVN